MENKITYRCRWKIYLGLLFTASILSVTLWITNLNNLQTDSNSEIINLHNLLPLAVLNVLPVVWKFSQYVALFGALFQSLAVRFNRRPSTLDYTCVLVWLAVTSLHCADYRSSFAQKIGLFKDDLFILLFCTSTSLALISTSRSIVSLRKRRHRRPRTKFTYNGNNSACSDVVSGCNSFVSSLCSCCFSNRSSSAGKQVVRSSRKRTEADEHSPSRLLGSRFSSLSLGPPNSSDDRRSETGSVFSFTSTKSSLWSTHTGAYMRKPATNGSVVSPSKFSGPTFNFLTDSPATARKPIYNKYYGSLCGPLLTTPPSSDYCASSTRLLPITNRNFSLFDKPYAQLSAMDNDSCYRSMLSAKIAATADEDTVSLMSGRSSAKWRPANSVTNVKTVPRSYYGTLAFNLCVFLLLPCSLAANVYVFYYFTRVSPFATRLAI